MSRTKRSSNRSKKDSSQVLANSEFQRPRVEGKFIYVGNGKLLVRGVTYGAFCPDKNGDEYTNQEVIDKDFEQMAANGINTVRIPHTMPPRSLLDIAQKYGLYVMVGLSAEQYIGYLIDKKKSVKEITKIVRAKVRNCAGHPAILCYAIGNEIQAPIARWLGRRRVESYLKKIYKAIKAEDPEGLVTYVNYPTTEYLQLPFLDIVCFNVYLESQDRFSAYLARLQNIAGNRPLMMSEAGLDSIRNGKDKQAKVLDWQIRTVFSSGCAGAFVFAWTDEWYRGDIAVKDWAFGITDWDRNPKPALTSVRKAFSEVPFSKNISWPYISVIVCTHNGARTITDCLEGLKKLEYPNYEVIVVNDGATDATKSIIKKYSFKQINTNNCGLSNARNIGLKAAKGEIVAYIDDDAYPDLHWLTYLANTFLNTNYVGVGGPNIPCSNDGTVANCVANAPGGPIHVLLSDQEAEHIPGCNMAFRKSCLQEIGGFDPKFRIAGDDVDICWHLQQNGYKLGFNPGAMVWHHRRNSIHTYLKQQKNYGKAESMLKRKWPEKYADAYFPWSGRMYGNNPSQSSGQIYHGSWGSAPFQSLYQPKQNIFQSFFLTPFWYIGIIILAVLSVFSVFWTPLLIALPFLIFGSGASFIQANVNASRSNFNALRSKSRLHIITTLLYLLQPLARLYGQLSYTFTKQRNWRALAFPWPRKTAIWTERWQAPEDRLKSIEADLKKHGLIVLRGGDYDSWDLELRNSSLGALRMCMAVEEHGAGRQYIRFNLWPKISTKAIASILFFATISSIVAFIQEWTAFTIVGAITMILVLYTFKECTITSGAIRHVLKQIKKK